MRTAILYLHSTNTVEEHGAALETKRAAKSCSPRREGAEEILCGIRGNYNRMPPTLIK